MRNEAPIVNTDSSISTESLLNVEILNVKEALIGLVKTVSAISAESL